MSFDTATGAGPYAHALHAIGAAPHDAIAIDTAVPALRAAADAGLWTVSVAPYGTDVVRPRQFITFDALHELQASPYTPDQQRPSPGLIERHRFFNSYWRRIMETIVIVGGGAGGLELATRLGDTLGRASVHACCWWTAGPATSGSRCCTRSHRESAIRQVSELSFSAQALDHDFEFVKGDMLCMDRAHRTITLSPRDGGDGACRVIAYDKLVLALGSVTNFFDVPAPPNTRSRWTAWPMRSFRRRFFDTCTRAGESKQPVNVVIVGGGATGVELAAELSNTAARWPTTACIRWTRSRTSASPSSNGPAPAAAAGTAAGATRGTPPACLGIDVLTSTSVASVTRMR
jgi:NADH dehydrogenase